MDEIHKDEEGEYMLRHGIKLTVEMYKSDGQNLGEPTGLTFSVQHGTGITFGSLKYILRAVIRDNLLFHCLTDQLVLKPNEHGETVWMYKGGMEEGCTQQLYTMKHAFPTSEARLGGKLIPSCFAHWIQMEAASSMQYYDSAASKLTFEIDEHYDLSVPRVIEYSYGLYKVRLPSD